MENNNVEFLECRTCIFRNVSKPKKTKKPHISVRLFAINAPSTFF